MNNLFQESGYSFACPQCISSSLLLRQVDTQAELGRLHGEVKTFIIPPDLGFYLVF